VGGVFLAGAAGAGITFLAHRAWTNQSKEGERIRINMGRVGYVIADPQWGVEQKEWKEGVQAVPKDADIRGDVVLSRIGCYSCCDI